MVGSTGEMRLVCGIGKKRFGETGGGGSRYLTSRERDKVWCRDVEVKE